MIDLLNNIYEIEKILHNLSVEQLMELEEKIVSVIKMKIKSGKGEDWRKDFLTISQWSHLNDENEVKVDKWTIETF
jgi:hypothetical protein